MMKFVSTFIVTLVFGWMLAGSATSASAHYGHHGHKKCNCGPLATTVHIRTVHTSKSYKRYHDRVVYRHVPRYHRIVTVTRIQPIVHILDVTRVHHRTVYFTRNTYANETVHLRPLTYVHSAVVNTYEGGCGCGR